MFDKLRQLLEKLSDIFDTVTVDDDKALQKENTATLFVDEIVPEYLTFQRKRYTGKFFLLFSLKGSGMDVYDSADQKISEIENICDEVFSEYSFTSFHFSYVTNFSRLFVMMEITTRWEQ